jgi:hypothetical protein
MAMIHGNTMLLRSVTPNGVRNSHSDCVLMLDDKPAAMKTHAASHAYKTSRCLGIPNIVFQFAFSILSF